jgi:hypothetical protein
MYLSSISNVVPFGSSTDITVRLDSESQLVPVGHQRPWDRLSAQEVTAIELRPECYFSTQAADETISIQLSNVSLNPISISNAGTQPILVDLALTLPPKDSRAVALLSFRIEPPPPDPYSADGAGNVRILMPNGSQALAYLHQEFVEIKEGHQARYVATGKPIWKAWLYELPTLKDTSVVVLSAKDRWTISTDWFQKQTLRSEAAPNPENSTLQSSTKYEHHWDATFLIPMPPNPAISGNAPLYWELKDTQWQRPTPVLKNSPSTTSTLWSAVPFWTARWGGFGDGTRPNGELAMRMDVLLQNAFQQEESMRPLIILDGATLDRHGTFNWESHPLRKLLHNAGEIFRSEHGLDFSRRWMRYACARWGHSKSVSSLMLTPTLATPGASLFHTQFAAELQEFAAICRLPVYTLHPFAREPQIVSELGTFENSNPQKNSSEWTWSIDQRICSGTGSILDAKQHTSTNRSNPSGHVYEARAATSAATFIGVVGNCNPMAGNYQHLLDDFNSADALTFDVFIPPDMPSDLRIGVHLRDRNGQWFQTLLPKSPRPNEWYTFALDISGKNIHHLRPGGIHDLTGAAPVWTEYSRHRIRQIGLYIFSTHPNWTPPSQNTASHEPVRARPLCALFDTIRAVRFEPLDTPRIITPYTLPQSVLTAAGSSADVYTQGIEGIESVENVERIEVGKKIGAKNYQIGDLWQAHFKINKIFPNPYDPRDCDLSALITTPSGKKVRVPAFFNQLCRRRQSHPSGDEIVEPLGEEFFTVRYRILELGDHQVKVELREGGTYQPLENSNSTQPSQASPSKSLSWIPGQLTGTFLLDSPAFRAKEKSRHTSDLSPVKKHFKGFVRTSSNKRNLEWDDGSFFYPLGPCLRSPSDNRIPYSDKKWTAEFLNTLSRRGTYQYDDYFEAYQKAGINWARVWMCSWWVSLEWRRDWPGYHGVGRYNLLNAWRLDYLLDQAEKKDITLMLCLTNHGQYSLEIDPEWQNNPYATQLGGPLAQARDFFRENEAKIWHQNKLRYILARYGHSPAIMAWSLFTEIEWTQEYQPSMRKNLPDAPAPNIESWHVEMANFLKQNDPNQHLVSTHFSYPVRGERTLMKPEIDIPSSNAYSASEFFKIQDNVYDAASSLSDFWAGNQRGVRGFHIFNKPALVEEQGRHWMGFENGVERNTRQQLDADLHAGLWGSMVQPLCGATGYWWWLHLHFDQRYDHYRALANFMKNEDFRANLKEGETPLEPAFRALKTQPTSTQAAHEVLGRALKSNQRLYGWIYHPQMPLGGETPAVEGAKLKVSGLIAGLYRVEFWDTYKGVITESREIEIKNGVSLELTLPTLKADLALKIKPRIK